MRASAVSGNSASQIACSKRGVSSARRDSASSTRTRRGSASLPGRAASAASSSSAHGRSMTVARTPAAAAALISRSCAASIAIGSSIRDAATIAGRTSTISAAASARSSSGPTVCASVAPSRSSTVTYIFSPSTTRNTAGTLEVAWPASSAAGAIAVSPTNSWASRRDRLRGRSTLTCESRCANSGDAWPACVDLDTRDLHRHIDASASCCHGSLYTTVVPRVALARISITTSPSIAGAGNCPGRSARHRRSRRRQNDLQRVGARCLPQLGICPARRAPVRCRIEHDDRNPALEAIMRGGAASEHAVVWQRGRRHDAPPRRRAATQTPPRAARASRRAPCSSARRSASCAENPKISSAGDAFSGTVTDTGVPSFFVVPAVAAAGRGGPPADANTTSQSPSGSAGRARVRRTGFCFAAAASSVPT